MTCLPSWPSPNPDRKRDSMNELKRNTLMYADITVGHGLFLDESEMTAEEIQDALKEDRWFRGLFSYAGVVVSELFDDVTALRRKGGSIEETLQMHRLPEAFRDQYTPVVAQAFLCSVVAVTQKFAGGWSPVATLAEELAVKLILDEAEALREQAGIHVAPHIVSDGYDRLLEDVDFEWLYHGKAGYLGEGAHKVSSWFSPYREERHAAPYARIDLCSK
jgi:hypothetical protein